MPVVVAWIGEMLLSVVGQMVVSAAIALGIGFASNAVGNAVDFGSNIKSVLGGAGPLVAYLGFF